MADHDEPTSDRGDHLGESVQEGLEHLQGAAREMIRATRSLLDAAEELVEDPDAVKGLVGSFAAVAQAATRGFRQAASRAPGRGDEDDGHVESIKLS